MRPRSWSRPGVSLIMVAIAAILGSCTDAPTEAVGAAGAEPVAFAQVSKDKGAKNATLQFARVKSDGTLVDGTAISAERFSTGLYRIKFAPGIGRCAAVANSTAFPGYDLAVFRIVAQIDIGFGAGGTFDDETVRVSLFDPADGTGENSSFSLVLVCP